MKSKVLHSTTQVTSVPSLSTTAGGILGVGEDVDHVQTVAELFYARNFPQMLNRLSAIIERKKLISHRWNKPSTEPLPSSNGHKEEEFQYLPISGVRRKRCVQGKVPLPKGVLEKKHERIYDAFSQFVEHCLTHLETNFEYRMIESSEDLTNLLDLKRYARERALDSIVTSLRLSSLFGDLMKIIEHTVHTPVTTMHLLAILHLCDVREHNLWSRLETAVTLFDMAREATKAAPEKGITSAALKLFTSNSSNTSSSKKNSCTLSSDTPEAPTLNLNELRTLLWYSLGMQDFNDQFFVNRLFDLKFLRANLTRIFYRAVAENGVQLLE